ncbi:MAG: hypothetical protein J0M08_05495 [Bacteroidetes bacterium]|nr:hypothetical protein [Bacteroidota bacterium]
MSIKHNYFLKNITLFILFAANAALSQPYGNEWINYSQKYYKIKVVKDGVYKLDSTTLAKSGFPVATIDPRNLQLFARGKEQPMHIVGQNDGKFNTNDYLLFYGVRNDGYLDSALYLGGAASQPNPYYSLYNDTAIYFLTYNSSLTNKRFALESDITFSSYTPINYVWKKEVSYFSAFYLDGATNVFNSTDAEFTNSEGWFDTRIDLNVTRSYNLPTNNIYTLGPNASVKTLVVGSSNFGALNPDHHVEITVGGQMQDSTFEGYVPVPFTFTIPPANLTTVQTTAIVKNVDIWATPSLSVTASFVVPYFSINYPHTLDFEGKSLFDFHVKDNQTQSKSYIQATNIPNGNYWLFDITNQKIISYSFNGATLQALIPNSNNEKHCLLIDQGNFFSVDTLLTVSNNGTFTDFTQLAVDSAYLIVTHKSLLSEANNYKQYRSMDPNGGNYNVVVADVDELYDQFAHGIVKNPLSIRRFSEFAYDTWNSPPKYLFLIGKSAWVNSNSSGQNARKYDANYYATLVPSINNPPCDNFFTMKMNGSGYKMLIPTGRYAARTPNEVDIYLDKVKEHESAQPDEWMKNILHFGGGTNSGELQQLKGYLDGYKTIAEDTMFGGIVKTFSKTTSAPIQIAITDSIKGLINNGVTLMTFFGHGGAQNFDQSIDLPQNYNNKGKYPMLVANSCYSGNIHIAVTGLPSLGESFVILQDKGTIGFLGTISQGISTGLDNFTSRFYTNFSKNMYGQSIGNIIQKTVDFLEPISNFDPITKATCMEMTLHCDPAIVLNSWPKPDYKISNSNVYFDTKTNPDSIKVYAIVTNVGRAISDSFYVEFTRKKPNDSLETIYVYSPSTLFKDTLSASFAIGANGYGVNKFIVKIDPINIIDELVETNNSTNPEIELLVSGRIAVPIYPYNYAVIPNDTVTLKASSLDPLALSTKYIFEIDTTLNFSSPFKQVGVLISTGGVLEWTPSITLKDSSVYFWRISPDSIDNTGFQWRTSSFQYIQGKHGWGQANFSQYNNNEYEFIKQIQPTKEFDYFGNFSTLLIRNAGYWNTSLSITTFMINGLVAAPRSCLFAGTGGVAGINFVVINPKSGKPWNTGPNTTNGRTGKYKNYVFPGACDNRNTFDYCTKSGPVDSAGAVIIRGPSYWRQAIRDFIDSIPNGHIVLAYTIPELAGARQNHYLNLDTTLYSSFEKFGAGLVRTVNDTTPYLISGVKGAAIGSATEIVGAIANTAYTLTDTFLTNWNEGSITSTLIGPSKNWKSLHWREKSIEAIDKDSVMLNVIGVTASGTENNLASFPPDSADVFNLGAYANAATYPYLKLISYMKDDSFRTPSQLKRWQVLYDPYPEAAINPKINYALHDSMVQEGADISLSLGIENVSEFNFVDSFAIKYWVEDRNRVKHILPGKVLKPPFNGLTSFIDTIKTSTYNFSGNNNLWVEINPLADVNYQEEQYHFNNLIRVPFKVQADKINPLLDVTFDGLHIINGDIINPRPTIIVQVKDENKFLALNDTNDFALFLKKPSSSNLQKIYFDNGMSFTPASLPSNSCKITYNPILTEDGIYELLVQAKDRSKNQSGKNDYKIQFEVIQKSSITEVMNYPNPFSTSTRFVFTLTGSEVPTDFRIQIMTITGKVVREISQAELGPIRIGKNITQYAWNGKDDFGDQLANGVYLYKVITRLSNESIEKRATDADQYFTKGFGKMYLMR